MGVARLEYSFISSSYSTWLTGFYRQFDTETKQLYQMEPFWRVCQKCPDGYCCSQVSYAVQSGEGNPFIIEDWGRMLIYIRDVFSPEQKSKLIRAILANPKYCIFLSGGRCSIHPARPWSCRTHPYTVSFQSAPGLFPNGELALPSCAALAPLLGIKKDQLLVQPANVVERDPNRNLIKLKLKKHKPVWLVDATVYIREYQAKMPPTVRSPSEWQQLFSLAEEAGGEQGRILAQYVEAITELKPAGGKQARPDFSV
jgi:Fe-S-cluster containining protein